MTHASLFSGIGGPEIAAAMLGWDNLFHCEINPFGRKVLEYWFPNSKSYEDITKTDFTKWRGKVNVLTGGFPCQPFSYAGKRRGADDDRYLWPYMFKAIDAIRPAWVVAENVAGITTMVEQGEVVEVGGQASLFEEVNDIHRYRLTETFTLQRICDDLESHGYAVQPVLIPACAVGAPHRRDRVFIVARRFITDSNNGYDGRAAREDARKSKTERIQERNEIFKSGEPDKVRSEMCNFASDTAGDGRDGCPCKNRTKRCYCGDTERIEKEDTDRLGLRREPRTAGVGKTVADTESQQGGRLQPRQSEVGRPQQEQSGGKSGEGGIEPHHDSHRRCQMDEHLEPRLADGAKPVGDGRQRDVAYTSDIGARQREQTERQECGRPSISEFRECYGESVSADRRICGERWHSFPSVSPVHRGNDGIPFPMDGLAIPFSKWRTESLKAYGNAIVPQVMYEIFRAIDIVSNQ